MSVPACWFGEEAKGSLLLSKRGFIYLIHDIREESPSQEDGYHRIEHLAFIIGKHEYWQETSRSWSRLPHLTRIDIHSTSQLLDGHTSPSLFPLTTWYGETTNLSRDLVLAWVCWLFYQMIFVLFILEVKNIHICIPFHKNSNQAELGKHILAWWFWKISLVAPSTAKIMICTNKQKIIVFLLNSSNIISWLSIEEWKKMKPCMGMPILRRCWVNFSSRWKDSAARTQIRSRGCA